jgi:hypothetical protein
MFSCGSVQNAYCDLLHIFEFLYPKGSVANLINTAWRAHGEYVAQSGFYMEERNETKQ